MKAHACPRRLALNLRLRSRSAVAAAALAVLLIQTLLVWNFSNLDGSSGGERSGREKRAVIPEKADGQLHRSGLHRRSELSKAAGRDKLRVVSPLFVHVAGWMDERVCACVRVCVRTRVSYMCALASATSELKSSQIRSNLTWHQLEGEPIRRLENGSLTHHDRRNWRFKTFK